MFACAFDGCRSPSSPMHFIWQLTYTFVISSKYAWRMFYYKPFSDIILNIKIGLRNGFAIRTLRTYSMSTEQETRWKLAKPFSKIPSLPMLPFVGTAWHYIPIIGKYTIILRIN